MLEAIRKMTIPEIAAEMKSLLGLADNVSRMIPNFAAITEPLRKLTGGGSNISCDWGKEQEESLEKLKGIFHSETTNHTKLVVDASPLGLGEILTQKDSLEEEGGIIVANASRTLTDVEQRCSQTAGETLPVA